MEELLVRDRDGDTLERDSHGRVADQRDQDLMIFEYNGGIGG